MKTLLIALTIILGSSAFAWNPQQPRHDYDNAGMYQPELDASVRWMASTHNISVDAVKAQYSFYWEFKQSYEPQDLIISFFGSNDTCQVNADDVNNIQGQCDSAQ